MDIASPNTRASSAINPAGLWAGRVLGGLVVLFLLMDSMIKLVPLDVVAETTAQLGWPTDDVTLRLLGGILLACTLLYAYPRASVLGALLLTAYLGGAVATHARIGSPLLTHTLFGVYVGFALWCSLWLRNPHVRRLLIPTL
ncbi:MAG TPA: DoxX family protein [Microvirga sp.]|nr:DoxX family protein [Microvirga sp.]